MLDSSKGWLHKMDVGRKGMQTRDQQYNIHPQGPISRRVHGVHVTAQGRKCEVSDF